MSYQLPPPGFGPRCFPAYGSSSCLKMKTLFSPIFVCERLLQGEVGVVFELLNQKARVFLVLIALTR
jgi:hypothetical protein